MTTARTRQMLREPFGPRHLVRKSLTEGRVAMPATAALIAARLAIALSRNAADIVKWPAV